MDNETRDKARLKSWEGGEYIAVNNVRETACDTAHWGWIRGFNEGFDAGAASVDRTAIEWEFKKVRKMVEDTIPAHHRTGPAGVVYAAMVAAMDAVLETMEEGE